MKVVALIVLFGIIFFIFLGITGLLDYDEACYAEVSREMFLSGNLLLPQLNGSSFFEKPPLLYWAQVLGYKLFGISPLGARIFNALAGLAIILVTYLFTRRPLGKRTAFLSSIILGSSVLFVYLSRVALTDMLLTLALMLCFGCLYRAIELALQENSHSTIWFMAACLFSGFAMLAKGAIGAFFPICTIFFYLLAIKKLRLLFRPGWLIPGVLIICIVGLSWYFLLGFTHPEGFNFARDLFLKHHISRFLSPMQGHSGPIFYYIPVLFIGFLPWSIFFPWAIKGTSLFKPKDERTRFLCLFGILAIVIFVFFSLAATKLPNYLIPAFPSLAFITALLFMDGGQIRLRGVRWNFPVYTIIFLQIIFAAVLFFLPAILSRLPIIIGENARKAPGLLFPIHLGLKPYIAAAILVFLALAVTVAWRRNNLQELTSSLTASAFGIIIICFFMILPVFNKHFVAPLNQLSVKAGELTPENGNVVLVNLGHRPSVVFYSGKNTVYCSSDEPEKLVEILESPDIEVGLTTEYYFAQLQQSGLDLEALKTDRGYVLFKKKRNIVKCEM